MQIPKLANGGIIKSNYSNDYDVYESEYAVPLNDKYYRIYKRTKSRRIRNKNMKKSFRAMIEENLKSLNKCTGLSIMVNGVPLDKE